MATAKALYPPAELLDSLGGIPAERVRMVPYPGTATAADVLELIEHHDIACELIDGAIVEKAVGFFAGKSANEINRRLANFVVEHDLGQNHRRRFARRTLAGAIARSRCGVL